MNESKIGLSALSMMVAIVVSLASPSAIAGVWVGKWDPLYGQSFTNLGWRPSAFFNIPEVPTCNTDGTDCVDGASVTSAQVVFYDGTTNDDIAVINWDASELSGETLDALKFNGNIPEGFDTSRFPFKSPTLYYGVDGGDYGNFGDYKFALQFVIDYCYANCPTYLESVTDSPLSAPPSPSLFTGPLLFNEYCWEGEGCDEGVNDLTSPANRPTLISVTLVPEPASITLVVGALIAAGGFARRRAEAA